ncbi:hypothetical protein [Burkholderia phage BCSR5]|nr:hypothetical protein [Burkholderia phage BCSR5]
MNRALASKQYDENLHEGMLFRLFISFDDMLLREQDAPYYTTESGRIMSRLEAYNGIRPEHLMQFTLFRDKEGVPKYAEIFATNIERLYAKGILLQKALKVRRRFVNKRRIELNEAQQAVKESLASSLMSGLLEYPEVPHSVTQRLAEHLASKVTDLLNETLFKG